MNKLLTSFITLAVSCVTAVSAFAQEVKGDAKAAEQKIAMCIGGPMVTPVSTSVFGTEEVL